MRPNVAAAEASGPVRQLVCARHCSRRTEEASGITHISEPSVTYATNYVEKAWIGVTKERVEDTFIDISNELRVFRFIG